MSSRTSDDLLDITIQTGHEEDTWRDLCWPRVLHDVSHLPLASIIGLCEAIPPAYTMIEAELCFGSAF